MRIYFETIMKTTCQQVQESIPAYLLDAVDDAERASIDDHLPHCPDCAHLILEYQPLMEILPYAAEQVEPRPELKYRVLAATADARERRRVVARPRALAPPRTAGLLDWLSSLLRGPALVGAALLLVLALGLWNFSLQNQMAQQSAELSRQREFMTMLAYSDGTPKHLAGTDAAAQAVGRLYGGYDDNSFVVVTYDMPRLPADKVYQLWLIDASGKRTSGGIFTVDDHGRGWLFSQAPQGLGNYRSVGVTVEPTGGSPGPTGAKMLGGNL